MTGGVPASLPTVPDEHERSSLTIPGGRTVADRDSHTPEDLAGNSIGNPFEVDLFEGTAQAHNAYREAAVRGSIGGF